jgi:hypothetical protein
MFPEWEIDVSHTTDAAVLPLELERDSLPIILGRGV